VALRALARVNVAAIERNVAHLRAQLTGGASLCAVVKADGYGHGAVAAARAALAGGASWLAVATAEEAAELRAAGLADVPILVMGAISDEELPVALAAGADVVAWSERFVSELLGAAEAPVRVHVKFDTGMGRLGTRDLGEALRVAEAVAAGAPRLELTGAMTHFANSAATLREPASHFDLVRCGIAVYGLDPMNEDPFRHGLDPALELTSYIAAIKLAAPEDSVGYGRRFVAARDTWIATLPIGYGDGVRRALTNNCEVLVAGRRYPLVGTVSMDNIAIELGDRGDAECGALATIIGRDGAEMQTAEALAQRIGTINYEIVCGVSGRVPREYHRDGEPL
jgi:alanine racemase